MKENLIHYRTCVCNINYHVVWSVKYRRKVFTKEIEDYMRQVVYETAAEKGFTVHEFECGQMDHVHCFVSAPPKLSIKQTSFCWWTGTYNPSEMQGTKTCRLASNDKTRKRCRT